jgi:hypothetical protein
LLCQLDMRDWFGPASKANSSGKNGIGG